MIVILESQYFPSIAYFAAIHSAEQVIIERQEFFEKQSYRNRCKILTATKVLDLSVPVHHKGKKILIHKLEIDYIQKWQNNHWRSIETAYRNAPFFDYYSDQLKAIIYEDIRTLFELNTRLLTLCLKYLQIDTPLILSKNYIKDLNKGGYDFRSSIHPKKPINDLSWFEPRPYHQIFGKDFAQNLSILDLLFCEGPNALEVLKSSVVTNEN